MPPRALVSTLLGIFLVRPADMSVARSHAKPIKTAAPDLAVTGPLVLTPMEVVAGGVVSLTGVSIQNVGDVTTPGFTYGIYLSADPIINSADDILLFQRSIPTGLAPGQFLTPQQCRYMPCTFSAQIPPNTATGSYYVGILLDISNAVADPNPSNNSISAALTVGLAQLHLMTPFTLSRTEVSRGGTIEVGGVTVRNDGPATSASSTVSYFFSTDPVIDLNDLLLTKYDIGPIASGASIAVPPLMDTIPGPTPLELANGKASIAPGLYYLGVLIDPDNTTPESDETDNYVPAPIQVLGGPSDRDGVWRLQVLLVTGDVSGAGTDDNVSVRLTSSQDSFFLDYGRNDFERGDSHKYDLGFSQGNIVTLGDIQTLQITKAGSPPFGFPRGNWCLNEVALIVNNSLHVFDRKFANSCQWLSSAYPSSASISIPYGDLRKDASWQNADDRNDLNWPPPEYSGTVYNDELVSRFESMIGDAIDRSSSYDELIFHAHVEWGSPNPVSVTYQNPLTLHVKAKLKIVVSNWPDATATMDFNVGVRCSCGLLQFPSSTVSFDTDSWVINTFFRAQVEDEIANGMKDMTTSVAFPGTYCPTIKVVPSGQIWFSMPPNGPDLVLRQGGPPPTPYSALPGGSFSSLPWRVVNQGNASAKPSKTSLYLVSPTGSKIRLVSHQVPGLASCDSTDWITDKLVAPRFDVTLRPLPLGDYQLYSVADDEQNVPEYNETNNAGPLVPFSIGLPDLAIQPGQVEEALEANIGGLGNPSGRVLRINYFKILNQGVIISRPAKIRYYLSADSALAYTWPFVFAHPKLLGEVIAPPLYPQGDPLHWTSFDPFADLLLGNTPSGWYYLIMVVDADNSTREEDEANNRWVQKIEIW